MQEISVTELKSKIDNGDDFLLLDVREPYEYNEYNIQGRLIPLAGILAGDTEDIADWKEKEVVVHCRSGARSANAVMALESQGFLNVKNLAGGVMAWSANFG